jgi:transposase
MQVATMGLDIAKRVFQVHGVDAAGAVVVRRKLRRAELLQFFARLALCLIGIEACATAHHWAREFVGLGHQVRLVPPSYVVFRAVYAEINARLQMEAMRLGPVTYLSEGEAELSATNIAKHIDRAWGLWEIQARGAKR